MNEQSILKELVKLAHRSGVSDAGAIPVAGISVEDSLAELCSTPRCENYGLSAGCAPHVSGPAGMRDLLEHYRHAVVFKIDVPSNILLSHDRRDVFSLLHEIAADIEQAAVEMGCPDAKAFAGGACKNLFCREYDACKVLEGGECRNPHKARPSMSGFGINVSGLMQLAGWQKLKTKIDKEQDSVMPICGLILLC